MRWPLENYKITQGYSKEHQAFDLAAPSGTPVYSPVDGTVIAVGTDKKYIGGLYVIIRENHPDAWEYYTGHHCETKVKIGEKVSESSIIALVGQTGKATGPHTHFQVRKRNAGVLMHPQDVFNQRRDMTPKINRGDIDNICMFLLGREPTEGDYARVGSDWKTTAMAYFMGEEFVGQQKRFKKRTADADELERERDKVLYPEVERLRASVADPDAIALKELIKKIVKE